MISSIAQPALGIQEFNSLRRERQSECDSVTSDGDVWVELDPAHTIREGATQAGAGAAAETPYRPGALV